jgi:coniferyl-aldehyde dehydrogenase
VSVLAAGNHALVKPSELAPATADLIAKMIAEIFPPDFVSVVNGGPDVSAAFSALPFDHLIFTGSGRVGKLVMHAAAENLTPVTLELGGKSPALVHEEFPHALAADRICSGKFWNAGQTCVAPDYALIKQNKRDEFLAAARTVIARRYPTLKENPDYTRIINQRGHERFLELVADARAKGAEIIEINPAGETLDVASRVMPPTLIANVNDSMRVMQEEIFGPLLPVVTYTNFNEALAFINDRPHPLAFYYFDFNSARVGEVLNKTTAGGVTVNDTIFHLPQNNLPFGGVGPSGMGAYHGIDGFATFSKKKGVFLQSRLVGWFLAAVLKPPYRKLSDWFIDLLIWRRTKAAQKSMKS